MDITLPSSAVCYAIHDRMVLVDPNAGKNCRGGNIYVPAAAEIAGNAGVIIDLGYPNAALTDITQSELPPMGEDFNYNIPQDFKNSYSLKTRYVQASVNNAVLRISPLYA